MSKANDSVMTVAEGQGDFSALDRTGEMVENKTEINKKEGAKTVPAKKTMAASKRVRRVPQKKLMPVPKIPSGKPVDVTNPEFISIAKLIGLILIERYWSKRLILQCPFWNA